MSRPESPWKALSLVSIIGIDLAVCTMIGYWLGNKLDNWSGLSPWGSISGVFIGLTAGVLSIIPVIKKYLGEQE